MRILERIPVLTLVFMLLSLSTAWAYGERVTLKPDQWLKEDVIRVGDVFENAGPFAGHVLAPTPAAGGALTLGRSDLERIVRAFDFQWTPVSGEMAQIILRREAVMLDEEQLAAMLSPHIQSSISADRVKLSFDETSLSLAGRHLDDVSVKKVDVDPFGESFTAHLNATIDGEEKSVSILGTIKRLVHLPVLRNKLKNGEVIRMSHLDFLEVAADDIPNSVVVDPYDVVGKTPRRWVDARTAIREADLEAPKAVTRGMPVIIELEGANLALTAQGRVLQDGALGEVVSVMNLSSKRTIEGIVVGENRIKVIAPAQIGAMNLARVK